MGRMIKITNKNLGEFKANTYKTKIRFLIEKEGYYIN